VSLAPQESISEWLDRTQREREAIYHQSTISPQAARAVGMQYNGPEMADKGQRDGSCNRSACQLPLAGHPQFTMPSYGRGGTDGLLYYCGICEKLFSDYDRSIGERLRCTPVPGSETREQQLKRLYPDEPGPMDAAVMAFDAGPWPRRLTAPAPKPAPTEADQERLRLAARKRELKAQRLRKGMSHG